jgi:probable addiction module antidote protein
MTKKKLNKDRYDDYDTWLQKELRDEEFALAYLNEALNDEDPRLFLIALKNVIESQKKVRAKLAKESKLTRMSTYRILSEQGNPKWTSLKSLITATGLELHVQPARHR